MPIKSNLRNDTHILHTSFYFNDFLLTLFLFFFLGFVLLNSLDARGCPWLI